ELPDPRLLQRRRQRAPELVQTGRLGELPQPAAESAEDADRLLALVEQPAQDRQRLAGVALADRAEHLPDVLRATAADQRVHVGDVDAGALADVDRQLAQLLVELAHLRADQVHQQRRGRGGELLAVLPPGPVDAPGRQL